MSTVKYDFTNENFVVTGASSGMGRQIAMDLSVAGAKVLAIGRNESRLNALKELHPNNITIASVDVREYSNIEEKISDFVATNGKLKGCVHAAGINKATPLKSYDESLAKEIMDTSFWAAINLVKLVTKVKYGAKGSSSVLFSSVAADVRLRGAFAYTSSKAAINSAIGSIAKEIYSKGHRINTVMPAWIEGTAMTNDFAGITSQDDLNRHLLGLGHAEDVSSVVLFLLSDAAKWITGTNVVVDGGYLA